jgi:CcmD family protein
MRLLRVLVLSTLVAASGLPLPLADSRRVLAHEEQPPSRPQPQDEYVPIDQLPPQEELPAAPMVVAAYSFVWVAFLAYFFTLIKRLRKVETDLAALERGRR